jgi:hypothetical protein
MPQGEFHFLGNRSLPTSHQAMLAIRSSEAPLEPCLSAGACEEGGSIKAALFI